MATLRSKRLIESSMKSLFLNTLSHTYLRVSQVSQIPFPRKDFSYVRLEARTRRGDGRREEMERGPEGGRMAKPFGYGKCTSKCQNHSFT